MSDAERETRPQLSRALQGESSLDLVGVKAPKSLKLHLEYIPPQFRAAEIATLDPAGQSLVALCRLMRLDFSVAGHEERKWELVPRKKGCEYASLLSHICGEC